MFDRHELKWEINITKETNNNNDSPINHDHS